jgi:hypothetical protein
MRTFRDSEGSAWTVFEVRRVVSTLAGAPVHAESIGSGWLCFENGSAKRRLARFPERWREFAEGELRKLLEQARPAPRTTWRVDGLDDLGSSSGDARAE